MKINIPVRMRNPWFWVGLGGVILTAMGINPQMLQSWDAVAEAAKQLVSNPYMLVSVAAAVLSVFIDPTTAGIGDTEDVMSFKKPYAEPKKEGD